MDPRTANDALFDQAELLGFLYVHWRTLHKSRLISFRTLAPHRGGEGEGGSLRFYGQRRPSNVASFPPAISRRFR